MKTKTTLLAATILGLATSGIYAGTINDDDPSILSLGADGVQLERNMAAPVTFEGPSSIKYVVGKKRAAEHGVDMAVFEERTGPTAIDQLLLYGDDDLDIVLIGK